MKAKMNYKFEEIGMSMDIEVEYSLDELKEVAVNQKDSLQQIKNDTKELVSFLNSAEAIELVQSVRGIIKEASKPLNPKPIVKENEKEKSDKTKSKLFK